MRTRWLTSTIWFALLAWLPLAASAMDLSVAVINFQRLQAEAPQAIKARERIDSEFLVRKAKIETQEKQIAQLESQVASATDLDETERKSVERDIRSRTLRLQNDKEELENDRRLRASEESDRLRLIVAEVISEVAVTEKVDVVLEIGVVTWASARANITDRVLARMQELDKAAN